MVRGIDQTNNVILDSTPIEQQTNKYKGRMKCYEDEIQGRMNDENHLVPDRLIPENAAILDLQSTDPEFVQEMERVISSNDIPEA